MAPSTLGWQEIRIGIALAALAAIAVVLRFVSRLVKHVKIGLDDWMALAALISISAMLIQLILWAAIGNSGIHLDTLNAGQIVEFNKIFLANQFTYAITSPLVKLTIILFYRRIFATAKFRTVANSLCVGCIIWGIVAFLGFALQCRPLSRQWDSTIPGTCDNQLAFIESIQAINIFLDFAIFAVPWPMIWNLQRPWQDKVALSGVFLLGGFVVGASIYRMVALTQIKRTDITYTIYNGEIWTFVEPCIGLVCGCLPMIRAFFPAYAITKKNTFRPYSKQIPMSPWPETQFEGDRSRLDVADYHYQGPLNSSCVASHSINSMDDVHRNINGHQIQVNTSIEIV